MAIAVVVAPGESRAQSSASQTAESADPHVAAGLAHYEAREFEAAIGEFLAGHAIEPRAELLFAVAQAERRSGDCASALIYYRRFLATRPSDEQARAARLHIDNCRAALASGPGARAERRALHALAPVAQHGPWYHDFAGDALLGAGTLSVLMGVGFVTISGAAREHAASAATYPEYERETARARHYGTWGTVAIATGSVLVAGAVYRFHRRSARPQTRHPGQQANDRRALSLLPLANGLAWSYGGTF